MQQEGTGLPYNSFENWDVINGSVDVIEVGQFTIVCFGGTGKCVDMDGTTNDAGDLVSKGTFAPGPYILSFEVAGNQGLGFDNEMTVTLGDVDLLISIPDPITPFENYTLIATVGPGGDKLRRLPAHRAFWFGWHSVYPNTRLVK